MYSFLNRLVFNNPFITGTSVLGAFDPIDSIADVCAKENLWLHVDSAWGGGALVSTKYKHKLRGIHRFDYSNFLLLSTIK